MRQGEATQRGLLLAIGGALLFLACATAIVPLSSLPPSYREQIQSRRFAAADSVIFSVVVASYAEVGYSFAVTDRALGLVQTEPLMYPADENKDMWSLALTGVTFRWRRRATVRIKEGKVNISYVWETERKGQYYGESGWEVKEPDTSFSNQIYRNTFAKLALDLGEE